MSAVKDGLAKAWAEHLSSAAGFPFFPHRHNGETAAPFGVVLVKKLRQTVPGDDVHEVEVRVVVVGDTAETTPELQRLRAGAAYAAIEGTPRSSIDAANKVRLCGFALEEVEQAAGRDDDGRKIHSDVFFIRGGAAAYAP